MADPFRLLSQPKQVQDYDKVRKAISDLMSSEKAEEFDDGAHAAHAEQVEIWMSHMARGLQPKMPIFGCEIENWCVSTSSQALMDRSSFAWHGTLLEAMIKVCPRSLTVNTVSHLLLASFPASLFAHQDLPLQFDTECFGASAAATNTGGSNGATMR